MKYIAEKFLMPAFVTVFAALLAACGATIDAKSMQYAGASRPAPTDAMRVVILRSEPSGAHERLGEIVIDASVEPAPPVAQVEQKMREEGAKLGADAVVVVLDRVQPTAVYVSGPWWGRSANTVTGRKLVGVAIRYL